MSFIQAAANKPKGGDCFLCDDAVSPPERDHETLVLHRGQSAYVLMNLYPYNSGHLMIAPHQHTGDLAGLDSSTAVELMSLTQLAVRVLEQAYHPQAFNVGMNLGQAAGAGVPDHLHMHVVPRWNGDTNFMPIVGETKVLPESLEQTYQRLKPLFANT
jgi:ATP adenylyltransferase